MRFTAIVAVLAAAAATVSAAPGETNAERFARGLPPLAPARRGSPVDTARRSTPSGQPGNCNTGPIQCCNRVTTASDPVAKLIIGLLGIVLGPNVLVGLTCSPITPIGLGSNSCTQQPVCCENNSFNGLIAIGCSPINL